MAVTIRDLAQHLGISMAAVSKALNGYSDVSESTRRAVIKAARELNYTPNIHARTLKSKRSYNLGVLFSDDSQSGLTHPFFSVVLESFKKEAEQRGYDITFISHRIGLGRITYLDHCRSRELDGVCIANTDFSADEIQMLIRSELPLVTIDNPFPDRGCVLADNEGGMTQLVDYVIDRGHRRIGYIHGPASAVTNLRIRTFQETAKRRGVEVPDEYLAQCAYNDPQSCYEAMARMLRQQEHPTCILVSDDFSAAGAFSAVRAAGLRVPGQLSVAGYDGIGYLSNYYPRLTTVDQDAEAMGESAARMLISMIDGAPPENLTVPSRLIPGETVGCPAGL